MKKAIRYIIMFAVGWFSVWALEQFGIFIKGEDDEWNWAVAAPLFVGVFVVAGLLEGPVKKLIGEIE